MNKHYFSPLIRTLVFIALLLSLVGCSDMLDRLGNIALTITLDTPEVEVSSYRLDGTLDNGDASISQQSVSFPKHTLSAMKKGLWNLRITAYNAQGTQIGSGNQSVALQEGQIANATILVVFNQSAPPSDGFTFAAPSRFDSSDGQLIGTTIAMEYRLSSSPEETPYTPCTQGTTVLGTGTYLVRYAASHGLHAGEPLTITVPAYEPIQLAITQPSLTTIKSYDGTTEVIGNLALGTVSGVLHGDDVTVQAQARYDSAEAGTGKTLTVSYSLSGADAPNYLKPVDSAVSGIIGRKLLSVSGTEVSASKEYDNTPAAQVLSAGSLSGVLEGETVTCRAQAAYQSWSVGSDIPMYVTYTLAGEDAENYLAPDRQSAGVGQITKKQLAIAPPLFERNKTYDGTTSIIGTITPGNLTGVAAGDDLTVSATAQYESKHAGTSKPITVTYTLGGTAEHNYLKPADTTGLTGEIGKRSLRMSSIGVQTTKAYDGTRSVNTTQEGTLQNKVDGDDVTATMLAEYDGKSAGTGKTIGASFSLAGADKDNYFKPDNMILASNAVITKKALAVTGTNISTTKTFDGTTEADGLAIGTMNGVLPGDYVFVSATAAYDSETAGTGKTITITYTLSGADALSYTLPPETRTGASITKASLQGSVAITGTAAYGQVLSAVPDLGEGVPVTYQWKRNGSAIAGATGSTYTLTAEDIGNLITVCATADSPNLEGSITSAATALVAKGSGTSLTNTLAIYYPASPASPTIINLTGFSANQTNLEASVAIDGSNYGSYADVEVDSRNRAMILPSSNVTTATKVRVRVKETATLSAGPAQEVTLTAQPLSIGDYYQGGIVGYIFMSSDLGYQDGQIHGLIAAKTDTTPTSAVWSSAYSLAGTTSTSIGTGAANTSAIIAALDSTETVPYAASVAHTYTDGTYTDWFLPSHEELLRLRSNKLLIGNFDMSQTYWSSSQSTQSGYIPENHAHVAPFNQTIVHWVNHKDYPSNIRATRYF